MAKKISSTLIPAVPQKWNSKHQVISDCLKTNVRSSCTQVLKRFLCFRWKGMETFNNTTTFRYSHTLSRKIVSKKEKVKKKTFLDSCLNQRKMIFVKNLYLFIFMLLKAHPCLSQVSRQTSMKYSKYIPIYSISFRFDLGTIPNGEKKNLDKNNIFLRSLSMEL